MGSCRCSLQLFRRLSEGHTPTPSYLTCFHCRRNYLWHCGCGTAHEYRSAANKSSVANNFSALGDLRGTGQFTTVTRQYSERLVCPLSSRVYGTWTPSRTVDGRHPQSLSKGFDVRDNWSVLIAPTWKGRTLPSSSPTRLRRDTDEAEADTG